MSELSETFKALMAKHKENLKRWPSIGFIVNALSDDRTVRGFGDDSIVSVFPQVSDLVDKFLSEDVEDSQEGLAVIEKFAVLFVPMLQEVMQKAGTSSLRAV